MTILRQYYNYTCMFLYVVLCILVQFSQGYTKESSYILPIQTSIDSRIVQKYTKEILIQYEPLFLAMERGDIVEIQKRSKEFLDYLKTIQEYSIQVIIKPCMIYLEAMSRAKCYKEQREIFPFMVSPLLHFIPQHCFHAHKQCTLECKKKKKHYAYILTVIPPLSLSEREYMLLSELVRQYQNIHLALYTADMKGVDIAGKELKKTAQQICYKPLSPYIAMISSSIENLLQKKQLEKQIQVFYTLSRAIEMTMSIVRPLKNIKVIQGGKILNIDRGE